MKEYIDKEKLIFDLHKSLKGSGFFKEYEEMGIDDYINAQPVVTEQELTEIMQQYWKKKGAVEFAKELIEEIEKRNFSLGEILGFEKMIGDLLKEMGCCNDIG